MNTPVPILFTIPNFITAGSGGAMLNIIRRLDWNKFSPAVAVLKKGGKLDEEVIKLGLPLLESPFMLPPKPYGTLLWRARKAARPFRPYRFALWHSFHYADDYTEPMIARFAGARAWVYTKKNMNWGHRSWYLRTFFARHVIAQNHDMMANFFQSKGLSGKITLIPRGVDIHRFYPSQATPGLFREKLGVQPNQILVGCVAQLVPVKDHASLIKAAALLPEVRFMLAGNTTDQDYLDSLIHLADRLGVLSRIHFCGNIEDISAFLSEVDIFVLPTKGSGRMEGCPVALLEAMACGKACIATDIPGSRDLIINGESGLLIQPGDSKLLAKAIQQLAASPEQRAWLSHKARQRVEEHFTNEQEVHAHQELYCQLLGLNG